MASGMAVSASPPLWIRSASSATEPDIANTTAWSAAVDAEHPEADRHRAHARV